MASSLFHNNQQQPQKNNLNGIMQMIQSIQNPQAMAQNLMNSNPQFKSFIEQNKNKSVDQIAKENGIDLSALSSLLKK